MFTSCSADDDCFLVGKVFFHKKISFTFFISLVNAQRGEWRILFKKFFFLTHNDRKRREAKHKKVNIFRITWSLTCCVTRNISKIFTHAASNITSFCFSFARYKWNDEEKKAKYKINKFSSAGDILKLEKKKEKWWKFLAAKENDLSPKELKYCRVVYLILLGSWRLFLCYFSSPVKNESK